MMLRIDCLRHWKARNDDPAIARIIVIGVFWLPQNPIKRSEGSMPSFPSRKPSQYILCSHFYKKRLVSVEHLKKCRRWCILGCFLESTFSICSFGSDYCCISPLQLNTLSAECNWLFCSTHTQSNHPWSIISSSSLSPNLALAVFKDYESTKKIQRQSATCRRSKMDLMVTSPCYEDSRQGHNVPWNMRVRYCHPVRYLVGFSNSNCSITLIFHSKEKKKGISHQAV